jgi:hypothetical protein
VHNQGLARAEARQVRAAVRIDVVEHYVLHGGVFIERAIEKSEKISIVEKVVTQTVLTTVWWLIMMH